MMSPFSNANSPGSVGSNVWRARTRVTMFPSVIEGAAVGVAVVVVVTTVAAAGAAEELPAEADGTEDVGYD